MSLSYGRRYNCSDPPFGFAAGQSLTDTCTEPNTHTKHLVTGYTAVKFSDTPGRVTGDSCVQAQSCQVEGKERRTKFKLGTKIIRSALH